MHTKGLYHDLEQYLSWRSAEAALMVFFHTTFEEVADRQFLRDGTVRRSQHESLATYFQSQVRCVRLLNPVTNVVLSGMRSWQLPERPA